jgi:hypothetical protein
MFVCGVASVILGVKVAWGAVFQDEFVGAC